MNANLDVDGNPANPDLPMTVQNQQNNRNGKVRCLLKSVKPGKGTGGVGEVKVVGEVKKVDY